MNLLRCELVNGAIIFLNAEHIVSIAASAPEVTEIQMSIHTTLQCYEVTETVQEIASRIGVII
jgi:uncharacterized protein YlzI (FlbEa/FlbD family)